MNASEETVVGFIRDWIQERRPDVATLDRTANLVGSGLVDSLGFLTLVGAIETAFSLELDFGDADPELFTTAEGLAAVVLSCQRRGA